MSVKYTNVMAGGHKAAQALELKLAAAIRTGKTLELDPGELTFLLHSQVMNAATWQILEMSGLRNAVLPAVSALAMPRLRESVPDIVERLRPS